VEVRSRRGAFATLNGGDEWVGGSPSSPPAPPTFAERAPPGNAMVPDAARALPPPARPIRARVGLATERAHAHGRSFADAWQLLRQGDARRAAAAFGEVARAAGSDAIAEDASYWRGVALARAGDAAAARAALAEFIARYPGSPRFGEASVILGWSLLQAGDAAAARAAFQRASHDPSDRVRASAVAGLSRLGPTPRAAREQRGVANDVRGR
jgi:TolA-binding protein